MKFSVLFALAVVLGFGLAVQAQTTIYCQLCQFSVGYIDGYLEQNYTQTQIIKQLEIVCSLAPSSFAIQCDTFIEHYAPLLINYVIQNENPQTACSQFGFCSANSTAARLIEVVNAAKRQSGNDCQMCKMLVGLVVSYVEQNKTVSEIEAYLNNLCSMTPFAAQCSEFVSAYIPIVVSLIKNSNVEGVCSQLNICANPAVAVNQRPISIN